MRLKTLKGKFPIYTDRLTISVLGVRNINSYSSELVKEYFTEYLDNKSILEMTQEAIRNKLILLINYYSSNQEFIYEFRLLIKDKNTSEIYGGITLLPNRNSRDNNSSKLEIAYWVKPRYQGKGIATESLKRITEFIKENIKEVSEVTLEIQERNIGSISVAEKCGFKQKEIRSGAYCTNITYSLNWGR